MEITFPIIRISCQCLSACGALYMLLSLRNSPSLSSKILCFTAVSDFIFSITGCLYTISKLLGISNWAIDIFLAAPHWGFEISSFLWTGTLVIYILSRQSKSCNFEIFYAHLFIWTIIIVYIVIESYTLLRNNINMIWVVRIIWDIFAILTLFTVLYGLYSVRIYKLKIGQFGHSIIIGKLIGYMVLFLLCVSPNIINDILSLLYGILKYDENDLFTKIASILFSLWPFGTSIVFSNHFLCCKNNKKNYRKSSLSRSNPNPIPQELIGLEIGNKIGEGLAVVYKGKWRGAIVAVKMKTLFLENETLNDPTFVHECNMEIQEEAILMKRLTHPNIVLFMEAGFYHGSICIVSEYCSRGSLNDVLKTSLIWPMKIRLALGLAYGIQYLHQSKMIHRDLKSPNILVDETWHSKIADFGTLRFSEILQNQNIKSHEMTGLIGTTRWMAPEVILSKKNYTEKIDIYSFGLILWELIDGKNIPYHYLKWNHQIEKEILNGTRPIIIPNTCPPRWKVLINLCWQVEPTERPNIGELIRSLQRLVHEDIKDIRHHNVPFIGNLQQMDCDYILKYTRCDIDYEDPNNTNNIAILEDTGSSIASQSTIYTM